MHVEAGKLYLAAAGLVGLDVSDPVEPHVVDSLRGLPLFDRPWGWNFSGLLVTEDLILAPVVETDNWSSLGLAQIEWDR